MEFWNFHSSVFVNTTNIVVKSYAVLYMGVEVIICQSERSPERLMISQTPSIGRTSHQLRLEKEHGGNSPSFWDDLQNPSYSKQDIPNLPKFWTFHMSVFVNMTNMVVNSDTNSVNLICPMKCR